MYLSTSTFSEIFLVYNFKVIIQLLVINCIFSSPKPDTSTVPVPFSLELLLMPH